MSSILEPEQDGENNILPYAKTNMEIVIATTTVLVMPNCRAIASLAGATIEDDTGLMKVKDETIIAAIHFLRLGQLYHSGVSLNAKKYRLILLTF